MSKNEKNFFEDNLEIETLDKEMIELVQLKTQFTSNLLDISEKKDELKKMKRDTFVFNPKVKELIDELVKLEVENSKLKDKIDKLEERRLKGKVVELEEND